jgi:hypothetical protein
LQSQRAAAIPVFHLASEAELYYQKSQLHSEWLVFVSPVQMRQMMSKLYQISKNPVEEETQNRIKLRLCIYQKHTTN